MREYNFKWKPELLLAVITFIVFFLTEFVATGSQEVTDWKGWLIGTVTAGARSAAGVLIPVLIRWSTTLAGALSR